MKTLKKLDMQKFEAVSLSKTQNESIMGGTHLKTGETGGTDSNEAVSTGFPIRTDGNLQSDAVLEDKKD